ncbi:Fic family protein [Synechococcus sp. CCY9201]|uniref:Fic/DOC family protein n=1 Tax=Synechococcus sp. CCY9201 TaxID=174697 RepID=UPI002B220313|nr:Fic family protein [Synechococcus sp. CCY9201]MEA5475980.1 Fic family protein [Synechococcus sp. CCY9201]
MSRHKVVGSVAESEPGSNGLVLSNRLGITDPAVMEVVERDLLLDLYQTIIGNGAPTNRLSVSDLIDWHRQWLGSVYSWAGKVRTFNLSKQGFPFASAHLFPDLLKSFESEYLGRLTPFTPDSMGDLIRGLAEVHVEFVLIHPFREGNGRIARLLADVMACQAGIGPLDYSEWDRQRDLYFAAIRAGSVLNVTPMEDLFRQVLTGGIVDS